MTGAFVEGVRAVGQACSWAILLPVVLVVVAGRARPAAAVGGTAGIVVGGWWYVIDRLPLSDGWIRASGLLVVAAAIVVVSAEGRLAAAARTTTASAAVIGTAAGVGAVIATTWWRPCVGEELGILLTDGPDVPFAVLPGAIAFFVGLALPVIALGLGARALSVPERAARPIAVASTTAAVLLGVAVLAGRHDRIVDQLLGWST